MDSEEEDMPMAVTGYIANRHRMSIADASAIVKKREGRITIVCVARSALCAKSSRLVERVRRWARWDEEGDETTD